MQPTRHRSRISSTSTAGRPCQTPGHAPSPPLRGGSIVDDVEELLHVFADSDRTHTVVTFCERLQCLDRPGCAVAVPRPRSLGSNGVAMATKIASLFGQRPHPPRGLAHISGHEPFAGTPPTTKPQVKDLGLLCARGELNRRNTMCNHARTTVLSVKPVFRYLRLAPVTSGLCTPGVHQPYPVEPAAAGPATVVDDHRPRPRLLPIGQPLSVQNVSERWRAVADDLVMPSGIRLSFRSAQRRSM